jgi:peptide deformylase
MIRTMRKARGVGIAAPQVGKSLRLFIVASHPNPRYPKAPAMLPLPMINPELLWHSKETVTEWEGCLSIPGLRGQVPRYRRIKVRYVTANGDSKTAVLKDFVARIFQHEFDHVNGLVFLDRVRDSRTFLTESQYRKLTQKQPPDSRKN